MRQAALLIGAHRVALIILIAASIACWARDAKLAHEETLEVRSSIHQGMTSEQIEGVFKQLRPQHLRYAGAYGSIVTIVQTAPESGLKEWVLWVSLRQGGAAAVRIRTADSHEERPRGAPEDIIWQEEDPGTPFIRGQRAGRTQP